jgi:hemerythrin-like domain-containing protein
MQATQILMEEHRVIERVFIALKTAANRLSQGEEIQPPFFINVALFNKNFTDGCHHRKEEDVLFVAMHEAGVSVQGGPIGVLLAEHKQGRSLTRAMEESAQKWEAGDQSARAVLIQDALGYVTLLRVHIHKEDNIFFPMADRLIPADKQEKVAADFERIEQEETGERLHEKYLALAEVLEKESLKRV